MGTEEYRRSRKITVTFPQLFSLEGSHKTWEGFPYIPLKQVTRFSCKRCSLNTWKKRSQNHRHIRKNLNKQALLHFPSLLPLDHNPFLLFGIPHLSPLFLKSRIKTFKVHLFPWVSIPYEVSHTT